MNHFRHLLRNHSITILLVSAVLLRSLIASGYMLDTAPAEGGIVSVKLCNGPANTAAMSVDDPHHHHHSVEHHEHAPEHDHNEDNHFLSACSFWSASSQLLLVSLSFDHLFNHSSQTDNTIAATTVALYAHARTNLARAPPALS